MKRGRPLSSRTRECPEKQAEAFRPVVRLSTKDAARLRYIHNSHLGAGALDDTLRGRMVYGAARFVASVQSAVEMRAQNDGAAFCFAR